MSWLRDFFAKLQPAYGNDGKFLGEVVVLSQTENASIKYLLQPYLKTHGLEAIIINPDTATPWNLAASGVRKLIISRYMPKLWISEIKKFRSVGGVVIYFMDDDLMDDAVLTGLPLPYARKIKKMATSHFHLLTALCNEFWVGSQYLASKYAQWAPKVLEFRPTFDEFYKPNVKTICYHGTASHQAELNWLAPIIGQVLEVEESLSVELFGDNSINKLYRDFPGVVVLHPMSWSSYLKYTRAVHRDIGLAPMLPVEFNKGRGPTKFFDYTRMGAAGIYTDIAPYRGFIRDGVDGILLPNDPEIWKRTILALATNQNLRNQLALAARNRAMEMAQN